MAKKNPITICYGNEWWEMNEQGHIIRPGLVQGSAQWRVIGAVRLNNFGREVERFSLEDILRDPGAISWQYKNGRQRVHILDFDHGGTRMWSSPGHRLYRS